MKKIFNAFVELVETAAISWIITCGIVYLIALCFDLDCTLRIATGIWLIQALIRSTFNNNKKNK